VKLYRYALVMMIVAAPMLGAQGTVDSAIMAYVNGLKAIDNHAHPLLPPAAGTSTTAVPDTDNDALPLSGISAFPMPAGLDPSNPRITAAWRALYGYQYTDLSDAHVKQLVDAKARVLREQGPKYSTWALDRAGVDVMLGNRVVMGPGLDAPRFRWVSFVDPLLFPLDLSGEATTTPDARVLYPRETKVLKRYMGDIGVTAIPSTLDAYVSTIVLPTLDRMKRNGAVALKYEIAYLRSIDFGNPSHEAAAAIYAKYARGGVPTHEEYTTVEDYLFRTIGRAAGARSLAVHIHCLAFFGGYYNARGAEPIGLESVLDDSTLRQTNFVIVHGGWPYSAQTLALLEKPNFYADISAMSLILSPHTLANVLRTWIEEFPDKVLFGSDTFADHNEDAVGWPDQLWIASHSARWALAAALTDLVRDGSVSRDRAKEIANMVMRGNAARLYGIGR